MAGTSIAYAIRRIRLEHGQMTWATLARCRAATRRTILALEAGREADSVELTFRIAQAFDVKLGDVFRWNRP